MKRKMALGLLAMLLALGTLLIPGKAQAEMLSLTNGSFESGMVGWSRLMGNPANIAVTSELHNQSGGYSLRIDDKESTSGYAVISDRHPVVPGQQYTASASMYLVSGQGAIYFYFYDAAGKMIKSVFTSKSAPLGAWTDVAITAAPPAGAAELAVVLATGQANIGKVYFDNVTLQAVNLIPNGGFESGMTQWNAAYGDSRRMTVVSEPKFSGSYSLKLDDNSAQSSLGMESDKFAATEGRSYTAEARVRVDSGSATFYLRFYDAADFQLNQTSKTVGVTQGLWQPVAASMVAPPGTAKASVVVYSSQVNVGVMYFDDVSLSSKTMIGGTVTDVTYGAPLPWANAYLFDATDTGFVQPMDKAVTNTAGRYMFSKGVGDGQYVVRLSKDGYVTDTVATEVGANPAHADLALAPDKAALLFAVSGKVQVPGGGTPIAGANISLYDDNDTGFTAWLAEAVSSADGTFALGRPVPSGRYLARAVKPGYYTATFPVAVQDRAFTDVELQMPVKSDVTASNIPKPPAVHPRLYVTPDLVAGLQAKIATPPYQPVWAKVEQGIRILTSTGASSGTTLEIEQYPFSAAESARYLKLYGRGNSVNDWNSITETKLYTRDASGNKTELPIQSATWSSQDRDYDGNKTIDGKLDAESRWSADGTDEWIMYELGSVQDVNDLGIAWYSGKTRVSYFDVYVSTDGQTWRPVDLRSTKPPGRLDPPQPGSYNYSTKVMQAIEFSALKYLLKGDEASGLLAIEAIRNFTDTVVYGGSDTYRPIGDTLFTEAIVYDWCFQLLDEDDKTAIIASMKRLASQMEIGYPNISYGSITGHSSENQLMRDFLTAGAAVYDEDPEMYDLSATRFFQEFVPARNFWYLSGMHQQGITYGFGVRYEPELWAQWLFERMGHGSVFVPEQGDVIYRGLYMRRPDGQMFVDGDTNNGSTKAPGTYWTYTPALMLAASYYKDPHMQSELMRQYVSGSDPLKEILFFDPDLPTASPDDLPLTRYFDFPYGSMIARTGWGADGEGGRSSDVVAEMKIGNYQFGNHQHLDSGSFQLYYKGALAIDSGLYGGINGQYGSEHDRNYYKRTIADNGLLVYDPADPPYSDWTNDGGERLIPPASRFEDLLGKNYYTSTVVGHAYGPDPVSPNFSYLKGDLTAAYTDKVRNYERSLVFLNLKETDHPAALIVYDKVGASDPNFKKYWLLHSMEEPQVSGNTTTIVRSEAGYEGKLVNETLLAGDGGANIEKIGGPGHEFEVFGTNYPQAPLSAPGENTIEAGAWRVQISPKTSAATDRFLNVMQVMDNDGKAPLPSQLIDSESMVGATIADYAVLFSKSGARERGTVSFSVYGEGVHQFVVTDLAAGTWRIDGAGQQTFGEVNEAEGTLYFTGEAGAYTLTAVQIDKTPPVTVASASTINGQNGWYVHPVTVTLSAYDDLSGIAKTEYSLDGETTWQLYSSALMFDKDGKYTVSYRSTDHAGNVEAAKTVSLKLDRSAPQADLTQSGHSVGDVAADAQFTFELSSMDSMSGIAEQTLTLDGAVIANGQAISAGSLGVGTHTIAYRITDVAGHVTEASVPFQVKNVPVVDASAPGLPVLSSNNGYANGLQDGNYTVSMNMWWGQNGFQYKLYENDALVSMTNLTKASPAAQTDSWTAAGRANGTYTYVGELINSAGKTVSQPLVVKVTDATPGKAVLAADNWDGNGNFTVSMNLWWGTNATEYHLYENGVLIDTKSLTAATPNAQNASTVISGRAVGVYEYRCELVNAAGATSSDKLTVKVTN